MGLNQYGGDSLMVLTSTARLPNGHDFAVRVEYTDRETTGVTALVVASGFSLIAVIGLLVAISHSAWTTRRAPEGSRLFVRTHVAAYFVSLLLCDIMQAVGSIMNAKWVVEGAASYGSYCGMQGAIKHIADVGTATWTTILAIHTFNVLFLEIDVPRAVVFATLIGGWGLIGTIVTIGPGALNTVRNGPFLAISGYWCWISPEYSVARIVLDYMEMFMSAGLCFVLYTLVFLRIRGNISREGGHWYFSTKALYPGTRAEKFARTIAKRMIWYPVAYTALLVPIAIARFVDWSGHEVPFEVTIFADVIFLLSGVVNVSMFCLTRSLYPRAHVPAVSSPVLKYTSTDSLPESAISERSSSWTASDPSLAITEDSKTPLTGRFVGVPV